MKVLLNPAVSNYQNRENLSQKSIVKNSTTPIQKFSLPNYSQVDTNLKQYNVRQISFGSLANEKLIKEVEQLILEKKSLLVETADATIKAAKDRIAKFTDWADKKEYENAKYWANHYGTQAKEDYTRGHGGVWKWWNGDGSSEYSNKYDSEMESRYWKPKREIDKIGENLSSDKKIAELSNANDAQKKARLTQLEALIEKTKKMISYQGLQDSINDMLSAKGGVSDRIAGYQKEKDEIATKFVQKLAKSKDDATTDVPGCVILYGPLGTGKTTMLNGIGEQSKDVADVVDLTNKLNGSGWKQVLDRFLDSAKDRYINTQKRTIFLLNDAEKILSISKTDAPTLGIKLDPADLNWLDAYGNNAEKISYFKALLDDVSKIPDAEKHLRGEEDPKSAATFFITTNYPHLIHPDILSREGKATKIHVGLPSDFNLGEVLRFYFKKMNDVADQVKAFKHNPDYKEAIDGIAGITDKGRENIKKMIENDTIDNLHVDYNNMPYEQIAKSLNPNKTEGAYHNDGLRVISQNAFLDYLEKNPAEDDYRDSFFKVLINTKRDINPERYQQFSLIEKMLKDTEINPDDLDQLLKQKKMGILSEKKTNLLKYHVEKIKSGLSSLEEQEKNGSLTEAQLQKKKELKELQQKIDASEKNNVETNIEADDI